MPSTIAARLIAAGITLPKVAAPAGNYVPTVRSGSTLYVSGQIPFWEGRAQFVGIAGGTLSLAEAREAARVVGLNIVAQVNAALEGDLDRVVQCLKLGGFVRSAPGFTEQAQVLNGASDLMVEIFGERGTHTRAAIGVSDLPRGVVVEIDAIFEIAG